MRGARTRPGSLGANRLTSETGAACITKADGETCLQKGGRAPVGSEQAGASPWSREFAEEDGPAVPFAHPGMSVAHDGAHIARKAPHDLT